MIHFNNPSEIYSKKNIVIWLLSAFKAGFINSAGFLITGKFVSHVTGFGTQIGLAMGHEGFAFGTELLIIPVAFIFGGVVTSFVLDQDYGPNETPAYFKIQGLITTLIAGIVLLGELTPLGGSQIPFDSDGSYGPLEFTLIGLLCFICGLKNGLVTWTTTGRIRVTHLTGLSTDIGLNLLRTFGYKQPSPRYKEERIVNLVRILLLVFFSLGACISAVIYPSIGFKGFLVVFAISLSMTIVSLMDWKKRNPTEESDLLTVNERST